MLKTAGVGGREGVATGGRPQDAGIGGRAVVLVDLEGDTEGTGPVVAQVDLFGITGIDQQLDVHQVRSGRDLEVGKDLAIGREDVLEGAVAGSPFVEENRPLRRGPRTRTR